MKFYSQIDNFSKLGIKSLVIENAGSAPSSPVEGQLWCDTSTHRLMFHDGTSFTRFLLFNTALSNISAPTSSLNMNSLNIVSMADPVSAQDAATKAYVDNVAQGLDAKPSVRLMATTSINDPAAGGAPNTVDGVSVALNDRILLGANQTGLNRPYGGIWVVTTVGTGANGTWARAADMNSWTEFPGAYAFVEEGSTYASTGWVNTNVAGGSLGTTNVTWTQFSSAGTFIGGNGLTLSGTQFDVNVDSSSIEINADILRVKAAGITNAMLAGSIDLTSKVTGSLPIANGGTAGTTAATARANLNTPGMFIATNATLVASTYSSSINHALNSTKPMVNFYEVTGGERVMLDWKFIDANNIQIRSDVAVTSGTINVVVHS